MKTKLAPGVAWPGKTLFQIKQDPLPEVLPKKGKYQDTFKAMKVGECLVVPPHEIQRVAKAMRKFIAGKPLKVVACKKYDSNGRVWLMDK